MKKYQVLFMTPEGEDNFEIIAARSEDDAIKQLRVLHPTWIILDAYEL